MILPVFGLTMLWVVKVFSMDLLGNLLEVGFFIPFPFIFGLNYRPIANLLGNNIFVDNCDTWFYTVFSENATEADREYWGKNTGERGAESYGLINGHDNFLSTTCYDVNRTVPYFLDWEEDSALKYPGQYTGDGDGCNQFLMEELETLALTPILIENRNFDWNEDVRAIPDAVYTVHHASNENFLYDVKAMDHHIW